MCGIVGYIGNYDYKEYILTGLKLLQNRGYDSVGISCIFNDKLNTTKFASKTTCDSLDLLEKKVSNDNNIYSNCAIGHTRWATHGSKTDINAHPHHDNSNKIALVHNGIIENYNELKQKLLDKNYKFKSQTDTEIIAVNIGYYIDIGESVESAIKKTIEELSGTWALAIIHADYPNKIWLSRNGSPLLLGMEEDFIMVVSEQIAFGNYIKKYIVIDNNDLIEITKEVNTIKYSNNIQKYIIKNKETNELELTPKIYKHWMLKEIMEQPECIIRALNNYGRIENDTNVKLGGLDSNKYKLLDTTNIIILGCGTSLNAAYWSVDLFKTLDIFDTVSVYDGADFQIKDIPKKGKSCVIFLSQSGETKDLHRCIKIVRDNHLISIGVVNVVDSMIARETDCGVYLNAGREVGVASTKSFTNQCVILALISVWFSQNRNTCIEQRKEIINDLQILPFNIKNIINNIEELKKYTSVFINKNSCFILGKGRNEAIAKECALKIKEISYIHAEGFNSSSLKHGPFALIDDKFPIIIIDVDDDVRSKMNNIYNECASRDAFIIRITDTVYGDLKIDKNKTFGGVCANIYVQLLSYYLSIEKGYNPDFPKNLAKVVTVE